MTLIQNISKGISNIGYLSTSIVYKHTIQIIIIILQNYSTYNRTVPTTDHLNSKTNCLINK